MPPKTPLAAAPVWVGPESAAQDGGITVSLLQKFLACRRRFQVYAIEGWRAAPQFSHRTFYGSMWHAAEEAFAKHDTLAGALDAAEDYADAEARVHPVAREDITKWTNVVLVTFPEYVAYWNRTPTDAPHTEVAQEQVFRVPYTLPSGRVVYLRGKRDGVTGDPNGQLWLFETKTKGDVDEVQIKNQLTFDLQTMFYAVGLVHDPEYHNRLFGGVRYNVVRRPLSGGKGTIVRHKPTKLKPLGESEAEYYDRLRAYIRKEPETYFFRWVCAVGDGDLHVFRREFLDPCLEFLCVWYDVQVGKKDVKIDPNCLTWRFPYGVSTSIMNGYTGETDNYLNTGSTVGLVRTGTLFSELQ